MDILSFIMGRNSAGGSGGGFVEGVHFVTFMSEDGSTELYKRPVADGDDCADPVIRGLIEEPEKESTAQYAYTLAGWSASPNGALDSNILKAVTADKTVYANYAAVTRYYTVTYYDSDGTTVLKTESLAYGAMPSYDAQKEGYNFIGWVPALAKVTGNANYVAEFSEILTFAGASWADIARISEAGEAANYFSIGDTRQITFRGETITLAIAGFNHDDLADGSGKAGMTIISQTVPSIDLQWHVDYTYAGNVNAGYYDYSYLHKYALPSWKSSLPAELSNVIKQVSKDIDATYNSGSNGATKNCNCYLFALSVAELGCKMSNTKDFSNLGTHYELYTEVTSSYVYPVNMPVIKVADTKNLAQYWLRQIRRTGASEIASAYVDTTGNVGNIKQLSTTTKKLMFGFCI